jgi:hypothetical protein
VNKDYGKHEQKVAKIAARRSRNQIVLVLVLELVLESALDAFAI